MKHRGFARVADYKNSNAEVPIPPIAFLVDRTNAYEVPKPDAVFRIHFGQFSLLTYLGTPQTVCNMAVIHYDIIHYDITYCTQLE
jgi:hypothetical protein